MQTITFVFKCSNSNILEGAVGSKALCARRSWVIVMCSVGETFYSSGISPRLWNNWFFILEYSLVLAAIYLVKRSLKRFDLSDWSGVGRNILVYFRILLFFLFLPSQSYASSFTFVYKWVWRNLDCCKLLRTSTLSTPSLACRNSSSMLRLRCSDIWKPGPWKYSTFLSLSFFL